MDFDFVVCGVFGLILSFYRFQKSGPENCLRPDLISFYARIFAPQLIDGAPHMIIPALFQNALRGERDRDLRLRVAASTRKATINVVGTHPGTKIPSFGDIISSISLSL